MNDIMYSGMITLPIMSNSNGMNDIIYIYRSLFDVPRPLKYNVNMLQDNKVPKIVHFTEWHVIKQWHKKNSYE